MPTIVQTFQGRVTGLWGTASIRGLDGRMRPLKVGDIVHKGDVILTSQDGIVQLAPDHEVIAPPVAADLPQPPAAAAGQPATDLDRVISDLNQPDSPAAAATAPAAGVTGGDGAGDLTPGLRVDRISESTMPAGLTLPTDDGARLVPPAVAGFPQQQQPQPLQIDADSTTIHATEEGPAVNLGLTAPTGVTNSAVITITELPLIGQLLKADGTPVAIGNTLTAAELTGLKYVPPQDYNGTATVGEFGYSVTDHGVSVGGTVAIDLGTVNDAPVANPDVATVTEDTPFNGNVLTNDTDVDGDTLHVSQFTVGGTTYAAGTTATLAGIGSLVINADGSYTFTPAHDYNGPVPVVTYTATDGSLTSSSTLTLSVAPVNDAPVANPDVATATEDTPLVVSAANGVLANDTDVDGDHLSVTQFSIGGTTYAAGTTATLAGIGTLVINADGSYAFTPAHDYNGPVPVATYTVTDGTATAQSTLTLSVTAVNDAPVAVDDTASTPINTPITHIAVLANDSDVDHDPLTVTSAVLANPALGTVTINPDGTLNFTPASNVTGPVAITYSISDGHGGTASAVLTVTVGANTPPAGADETVAINEDTSKTFAASDFGYTDPDAGQSFAAVRIDTLPAAGTLQLNGVDVVAGQVVSAADLGHLVFTPAHDANGNNYANFTFSVQDSAGAFDTTPNTITFNVTPVNDPPVAVNDVASATEAGGVDNGTAGVNPSGNVLTNDTDPDVGDTKAVSAISGVGAGTVGGTTAGQFGTLVLNADGSYTYTVDNNLAAVQALRTAGDTLTDTFTYTMRDGAGLTSTATLTVTIHGADDAPVAMPDTVNATENAPLVVSAAAGVLANDTDVDAGDTKTVSGVAFNGTAGVVGSAIQGVYGTLTLNADGSYSYLANTAAAEHLAAGQTATEQFSYTMMDTAGASSSSTLTITVTGVNEPPTAVNDTGTTPEDTPLVVSAANGVLANDSDVDSGTTLSVTQYSVAGLSGTFVAGTPAVIAGVGTLQINADGSYSFTPVKDYNGPVPVATYTVTDGSASSQATLSLTVSAVNDPPVLSLDADHSHNTVSVQAISGLFNTGESDSGTALALGTTDSHYQVIAVPTGSTLTAQATGIPGVWVANDADSTWIGSTSGQPTGTYQYQTSFTLQAGADPNSVRIAFDLSSDNNLRDILVNGVSTGISSNIQYTGYTHVELDGVTSAFTSGTNTITFVVDNRDPGSPESSGPTGLRVDNMAGTVAVITPSSTTHLGDYAAIYIEGTPVSISDTDTRITDVDNTTMQSAKITLTNAQAGDVLLASSMPAGITASVDTTGTVVTLSGNASLAAYEQAIHAIQFNNTSPTPPDAIDRLITVTVNDGLADSNTTTTTVHVVPVDTPPALDLDANDSTAPGTGYAGTYVENGAGVPIADTDVKITDADSTLLHSATIHITNLQAGDTLTATVLPSGISAAVYDPDTGILQLSGSATLAAYQQALAGVLFSNSTDHPGSTTRTIEVSVNDGVVNSNVAISQISVATVNDAPAGTDATLTTAEDTPYVLHRADFGFTDPLDHPANNFASVIVNPTTAGTLTLDGVAITAATVVTVAQLDANQLQFTPAHDATGNAYATLKFQVTDDGGTANGGVDTDPTPNTLTFDVTPVNHAAIIGGQQTGATVEDTTLVSTGTLTVVDPDAGQSAFVPQTNVAGAHGTFDLDSAGHWTYTLDNADPAVQALAQGEQLPNEVFTVHSLDGTAANVTVSITGINDAPVAHADTVITNIAAGQPINIASGALTLNDTDIDNGAVLSVASSSNAVNGTVSGSGPVVFTDTGSFGAVAQHVNEATVQPGDSELNELNGSIATAYEIGRGMFGQVSAADAPYVGDPTLPSFKWSGRIEDAPNTPNVTDQDYLKVYLHAGEKITLDIDGADDGATDIGTNPNAVDTLLQFYDAKGNMLAYNDDASPTLGGLGSVGSAYHPNTSLDSYLEYTVAADGYYYINVTGFNNNPNGIVADSGNYDLWISITPNGTVYKSAFDYTVTDGMATSSATATVTTVQGSTITGTAAGEILIGGAGDDVIHGIGGHNWIQGGAGNDTMTGGGVSDTFAWTLADKGAAGSPAVDTITDFSVAAANAGGDVLDLRDLLQGEMKDGTNAGNLQNYLDFDTTTTPGSTIIHISSSGGFTGGTFNAAAEDQRIVLQGVDVRSPGAFGLQATATDSDVIHQLLQRGKLVTDGH